MTLAEAHGPRRIGVSAQVIREHGKRMGTLVTLRDVESLERIGNQLQVSERLAALGRVTAGVAHEVKNPLNSMRLWLEVLKGNMPVEPEPQQAVKMLDSEIDRLDRAVKTFLNFTKPVEMNLEETDLRVFLEEVAGCGAAVDREGGLGADGRFARRFPAGAGGSAADSSGGAESAAECVRLYTAGRTDHGLALQRNGEFAVISVADSGKGISARGPEKNLPAFLHHPARRNGHRPGEYVSVCATAQWPDRLRIGGRSRHHFPVGIACGAGRRKHPTR